MMSMLGPKIECVESVSGIRGIIGDTLSVGQVLGLAQAFGVAIAHCERVIVGRDTRTTGPLLSQAVCAGLRAVGCEVIDIGIVPTPTVAIAVKEFGAFGGIMISASHNPSEWNALKFFNREGRNVDHTQLDWIMECYRDPPMGFNRRWDGVGSYREDRSPLDIHMKRVLDAVDVASIRAKAPRVLIDCVNGSGSVLAPRLLAALGCKVVAVHDRLDLPFPRNPEPTAANVKHVGAMVRAADADIGFIQDPDADRLAIVDETGRYLGEEFTLVLCAASRLAAAGPGSLACTNLSTSRMLEDIAARNGCKVERTKVGEANVVDGMQKHAAVIGGEGNGGVIDPRVVLGRDSHIGMALVLELLAKTGVPLSEVVRTIPTYAIHKEKIAFDRTSVLASIPALKAAAWAQGAHVDERDGVKFAWPDRWVHLRASGTEPVSRIIAEAPGIDHARELAELVRSATGASLAEH
jgi:phosphomannomutase